MDVADELPFIPNENVKHFITELYEEEKVFISFVNVASEWILDKILLPHYGMPRVTKSA